MGQGVEFSCPLSPISKHSPSWTLSTPCPVGFYAGFITQACLIKSVAGSDRIQSPAARPSLQVRVGLKVSTLQSTGWFPLATSPHTGYLGAFQKSPLMEQMTPLSLQSITSSFTWILVSIWPTTLNFSLPYLVSYMGSQNNF